MVAGGLGEFMLRLTAAIGLVAMGAVACSPYNYGTEISTLSKSVDQLSISLSGSYAGLATDYRLRTQRYFIEDKVKLELSDNCRHPVEPLPKSKDQKSDEEESLLPKLDEKQRTNQAPCVLVEGDKNEIPRRAKAPPAAMTDEEQRAKALRAMAALNAYAKGLAAVTNAQDKAEYDASVTKLSAAVQSIAKLAEPALPGVSTIAAAGVNLIGWLVGVSLDQQRFATLKEAVNAVDKPVPGSTKGKPIYLVANYTGLAFDAVSGDRLRLLNDEVQTLIHPLGRTIIAENAYRQRLSEVNPMVDAIEAIRRSGFAWQSLPNAHDKLVKAVNEGGANLADLQKALGEFTAKVEALKNAVDAANKPIPDRKGA